VKTLKQEVATLSEAKQAVETRIQEEELNNSNLNEKIKNLEKELINTKAEADVN